MREINPGIFRAYDIRGIYPKDIDEEFANLVGKAFGTYIGAGKKVLLGRDVRKSSPSLAESAAKGILEMGVDVVDAGVIPTPLLYFAISRYSLDGGITVSASHNPPEWNGFKMCKKDAYVIGSDSGQAELKRMIENGRFSKAKIPGEMVDKSKEILAEYLHDISEGIAVRKGLKIGVDPGNGAYSGIASGLLKKKGAEVYAISDRPDGSFPSRSPEPKATTITELIKLVTTKGLDFGVAFDGDGDRALFVTENGAVIPGDILLALFVREYVKKGDKVVYEVSCSSAVEDEIKAKGGVPRLIRVGHSYFKNTMKSEQCRFGGEISGHMYFKEVYGSDDGLYAALKVADMLSKSGRSFSEMVAKLPKYSKTYMEFDADDAVKFRIIDRLKDTLKNTGRIIDVDGVKVITDRGWFVLRASNTTPKVKCSAEGRTEEDMRYMLSTAEREFRYASEAVR
ncbi:MAG: phosphomannomutase/phosphoglucomutase [Candidatus Micrarchaeota archaeon]|nr:phosphomannomutase/phosphoglucomutase [Candidatus Micrarchaeota archaeon]